MATQKYAFYVNSPSLTPQEVKASLEMKYPNFKIYFKKEYIKIGKYPPKEDLLIQMDESPVTGVQVSLDTDNIITVLPNMGNSCLGFILGWFEFAFMDFKLAAEVGDYLKATFGEVNFSTCTACSRIFPRHVLNCDKCGNELSPIDAATAEQQFVSEMNEPAKSETSSKSNSMNVTPDPVAPNPAQNNISPEQASPQPSYPHPQQGRLKDRNLALIFEILPGLFGLYGFGWIYSGNTAVGVLLLAGGLVWAFIVIVAAVITASLACFCTIPTNLVAVTISGFMLHSYTKQHSELFGPQRHLTLTAAYSGSDHLGIVKMLNNQELPNWKARDQGIFYALQELGQAGWELVTVMWRKTGETSFSGPVYYLKRRME